MPARWRTRSWTCGREGALRISHFLHLRAEVCSETLIEELAKFGPDDRIGIVSLMDHTPGQRQFRDVSKLQGLRHAASMACPTTTSTTMSPSRRLRAGWASAHEAAAVADARRYGAVLASHDDTDRRTRSRAQRRHGAHFAEFPTTVEAAQACHAHGIKVMMGAPNLIRGGSPFRQRGGAGPGRGRIFWTSCRRTMCPRRCCRRRCMLGDLWGDLARGVATVTAAPAAATGPGRPGRTSAPALGPT